MSGYHQLSPGLELYGTLQVVIHLELLKQKSNNACCFCQTVSIYVLVWLSKRVVYEIMCEKIITDCYNTWVTARVWF